MDKGKRGENDLERNDKEYNKKLWILCQRSLGFTLDNRSALLLNNRAWDGQSVRFTLELSTGLRWTSSAHADQ